MKEIILQTDSLCKRYRKHVALDRCSLTVRQGDIYGFVGNNGAGKTTLMKIVMGLTEASGGDFRLFDTPSFEVNHTIRKRVSAIIEAPAFYPHMTGLGNLQLHLLTIGQKVSDDRILQVMDAVKLANECKKKVRNYSMGMKHRLGIARVLLSRAELAILDEPTNGLDPSGILELREFILSLNKDKGVTFIISSHHIFELEGMVTKIGIIKSGKMVEEREFGQLKTELEATGDSIEQYFIEQTR